MTPPPKPEPQQTQESAVPTETPTDPGVTTLSRRSHPDSEVVPSAVAHQSTRLMASLAPPPAANTDLRLKPGAEPHTGPPASGELLPEESRPPPLSSSATYLGCTIDGRYRIESVIGEGGMGFVYRARHRVIDKLVAIKILRPEVARHHDVTDRFLIEAKAATAVGNAHIVDTLDFGHLPDGSTYLAMEYLDGHALSRVMETDGPLPMERIIHVTKQIAEGLGCAHDAAIVHRDLKPDNVFLIDRDRQKDFVKILDFGIAKVGSFQNKLTRAGSVFGTPHYMSPEQASGMAVDHRSDIYSLGVILYELCTGRVPFDAEAPLAILAQHLNDDPMQPSLVPGLKRPILPGLEAVMLKCLQKDRARRYQSMAEVSSELERIEAGIVPVVVEEHARARVLAEMRSVEEAERAAPKRRRVWPWVLAGGVGVAAVSAALIAAAMPEPTTAQIEPIVAVSAPGPIEVPEPVKKSAPRTTAPVSNKRSVALVLSPIDARVFRNKVDLGLMPVTIQVAPGESVAVEVRRPGYHTRKLVIDDSQRRVIVRLVRAPGTTAPPVKKPEAPAAAASVPAVPPASAPGAIDQPAAPVVEAPAKAAPAAAEDKPAEPAAPTNEAPAPVEPGNAKPAEPPAEKSE
ncbi:MAG TPA: serine/threonine-protein kinase [Polyangiaceae bacterium]